MSKKEKIQNVKLVNIPHQIQRRRECSAPSKPQPIKLLEIFLEIPVESQYMKT